MDSITKITSLAKIQHSKACFVSPMTILPFKQKTVCGLEKQSLKKGVPKHYAHATPIQTRFMKWVKDRTNIGPEPSFIPTVSRIISLRVPDIMTIKIDEK